MSLFSSEDPHWDFQYASNMWFFKQMLELKKTLIVLTEPECDEMRWYLASRMDDGAVRTMYHYYKDLSSCKFAKLLVTYRQKYFCGDTGIWQANNPSSAMVSLVRASYWEEFESDRAHSIRFAMNCGP